MASPRVTGVQFSDILEGDIDDLDLGTSKKHNAASDENVLSFDRDAFNNDDSDDDSDEEEPDETDPVRLAELQARYGFGAPTSSTVDVETKDNDTTTTSGEDNGGRNDDDWGFAGNVDANEGDVNFGDGDEGWGDFGEENNEPTGNDAPPVAPSSNSAPTLPPPQEDA